MRCEAKVIFFVSRRNIRTASIFTLVVAVACLCFGQTNRGGISGTVFDSNGAVVPAATVVITDLGTNQRFELKTSGTGAYSLSNLNPVRYRVEVETATITNRDVVLRPGSTSTEVTVQEQLTLLNLDRATTEQTITERQMQDLPL